MRKATGHPTLERMVQFPDKVLLKPHFKYETPTLCLAPMKIKCDAYLNTDLLVRKIR